MEDIIKEISEKIYITLGVGYKENIYHSSFSIELRKRGIVFQSEVICPILYENIQVGFERADIVLYDNENMTYVLEFKAQLNPVGNKEIIQVKKYLKNFKINNGYLINFSSKLEIKHVIL
jgi:GxxExxY protein